MTSLPNQPSAKKLGLVIDLDICVGCHACSVSCKEWNTGGHSAPLTDFEPLGNSPSGVWFNRVHAYEVVNEEKVEENRTVYFPKSCMHCEDAPCVPVCPTGASYKREEDGIVLVNAEACIGCKLCSWACPYGAREFDEKEKVMKKCTLCVDRIYDEELPESLRKPACVLACPASARIFGDIHDPASEASIAINLSNGYQLMPEWGTQAANHYLPRRKVNIKVHEEDLMRSSNPLDKEDRGERLPTTRATLDDSTSW